MPKKKTEKVSPPAKAAKSGSITGREFARYHEQLDAVNGRMTSAMTSMSDMDLEDLVVLGWKRIDRAIELAVQFVEEVEVALLKARQKYDREHGGLGVSDA